jgi:hypothetical protein
MRRIHIGRSWIRVRVISCKLTVKATGDRMHRSITLPAYISDVAKVQFWCAYAEVVLGEASFGSKNSTD